MLAGHEAREMERRACAARGEHGANELLDRRRRVLPQLWRRTAERGTTEMGAAARSAVTHS
jgi:hypothetical protein